MLLTKKNNTKLLFSRIEHGEILRFSPYSVQMRENTDQNNSEYGHFLRSECLSRNNFCQLQPNPPYGNNGTIKIKK